MRIHKLLAGEDASKKKAHGNTRSNGRRANKNGKGEVGERKTRGKWQIM